MKEIPLTQGKVALVDDEDFELLNQLNWYAYKNKTGNYYAVRNYSAEKGKRKIILMHREIMDAPKGIQVDHRNGDGLYNQKENLRLATHQQNSFNQGGYHLKVCCPSCQNFIKFLPHSEPKLYFGKYKGMLISEVVRKDAPYLRWLLSENPKSAKLKSDIREALCQGTK